MKAQKAQPMEGQMQMVAVHPRTGEAIDLHAAATDDLLDCHDSFADLEREMREAKREVDDELVRRMDHEGRRSFTFTDFKIDVTAPTEKEWDVDRLISVLDDFVAAGLLSGSKADKCVQYTPKVAWKEVKTLLSDPRLKESIEACFTEAEASRYVKVTRRR